MPYQTAEYRNNKEAFEQYYDAIEICDTASVHYKASFQKRNREMVDRADLCIFYVTHNSGGAYQTIEYSKKKEKNIINIIDFDK